MWILFSGLDYKIGIGSSERWPACRLPSALVRSCKRQHVTAHCLRSLESIDNPAMATDVHPLGRLHPEGKRRHRNSTGTTALPESQAWHAREWPDPQHICSQAPGFVHCRAASAVWQAHKSAIKWLGHLLLGNRSQDYSTRVWERGHVTAATARTQWRAWAAVQAAWHLLAKLEMRTSLSMCWKTIQRFWGCIDMKKARCT